MLKLLLDEHISPTVVEGLRRRSQSLSVCALVEWEGGSFLGQDDAALLQRAAAQHWALVTYDRRTIPPLLKLWAEAGQRHGGIIFVDERTIPPSDIGSLTRALAALAAESAFWDWSDRVIYLRR